MIASKAIVNQRGIALDILLEINQQEVFSHMAIANHLEKHQSLDKRSRAFINRLVMGTLERQIELDYIINTFSKTKVKKMKPAIREILRMSVYQLMYMHQVPASAVVNEAVNLTVKRGFKGLKGFVNGVLRNIERQWKTVAYPQELLAKMEVEYSLPQWMLARWLAVYDVETVAKMGQSFQKEAPLTIRVNLKQVTVAALMQELAGEGITATIHPYLPYALQLEGVDYVHKLAAFKRGDFYIQDISSMLVGHIAAPQPEDQCIDVCAAPGGKSLHIAEQLSGSGHILARDLTATKVELIRANAARQHATNVTVEKWDALIQDTRLLGQKDLVLADLPCSGLGILGKKADLRYKSQEANLAVLAQLQRDILAQIQGYVKIEGTLLYSTCTINQQENEQNVAWFLERFPQFSLVDLKTVLPPVLHEAVAEQGYLQLLPGIHESDGFFIAKFQKNA